jgi:hypothetical protein
MSYYVVEEQCPACRGRPVVLCNRCLSTGWLEVYRTDDPSVATTLAVEVSDPPDAGGAGRSADDAGEAERPG